MVAVLWMTPLKLCCVNAVTGESGLLQGPGSSSDVTADRGDTEEAFETAGASFSLCSSPSSHSSEVIFASWLCLSKQLEVLNCRSGALIEILKKLAIDH